MLLLLVLATKTDGSGRRNKRYAGLEGYDIKSCAAAVMKDYGKVSIFFRFLSFSHSLRALFRARIALLPLLGQPCEQLMGP